MPTFNVGIAHTLFCSVALGAVADRSIRTPTSWMPASASQHVHQTEEDRLVRIPAQQADTPTAGPLADESGTADA